jgi:hypothetical protein
MSMRVTKAVPAGRRVGGRLVTVLLSACSAVAVFDVWRMLASLH